MCAAGSVRCTIFIATIRQHNDCAATRDALQLLQRIPQRVVQGGPACRLVLSDRIQSKLTVLAECVLDLWLVSKCDQREAVFRPHRADEFARGRAYRVGTL